MRRTITALAALAGLAAQAHATWSIVLINTRTGEVVLGSATCLTNFDLQEGTPVLLPGIGGATAQSSVDQNGFNRVFIRDRLLEGVPPGEIVAMLEQFDGAHRTRQYGIADTLGGAATFTGSNAGAWAGGVTGRVGDVVYAVQGNVLTGAPVVTETEQVIVASLGDGLDLPETLMLAMEEARLYGGDGRCSCGNDADGCGSPPDGWDWETGKSAHIAYMLSARAGDGFGCNSIYKTGRTPFGLAAGDFNNDGLTDVATGCRNDGVLSVLLNNALSPEFVTFGPAINVGATGNPNGVAAADFDRDGNLDLAYADSDTGLLGVLTGRGDGTFDVVPRLHFLGAGTTWVAVGDFNGDGWTDAAATNFNAGTLSVLINDGSGTLQTRQTLAAGAAPGAVVAAEIDGQPGLDLACTDQNGAAVLLFAGDGAGGFSLWQTLAADARPLGVAAGDFDGDGRTDIATSNRDGRNISVLRQTSPGVFTGASLAPGGQYTAIETIDANGDGLDDIAAGRDGNGAFVVLLGRSLADPQLEGEYAVASASNDLVFADFNGDGLGDVVSNARSANGVMAVAALGDGPGLFNNGVGCATSDYFMEFNIARQSRDAPDPVVQLHDLFDAWRADLLGVADAVRSLAAAGTERLPVGSATVATVEPRDWTQAPVGAGLTLLARHGAGSAGLAAIGAVADHGDGSYSVEISAADLPPDTHGVDSVEIVVVQGGRSIVLMPPLTLRVVRSVVDWNGDGVVDPLDLDAFIADWQARDPATDLDASGGVNVADLIAYLHLWAGN